MIKIILLEHCSFVASQRFIFSSMKQLFPIICRCVGRCCIATLWLLHYGHRIIVCEWPRQCGCYVVAYGAKHWGGRAGDGHPSRILVWLVPPGRFVPICFQSLQLDASYPLCPCRPQKERPLRELLEITMSRTSANSSMPRKSMHKTIS